MGLNGAFWAKLWEKWSELNINTWIFSKKIFFSAQKTRWISDFGDSEFILHQIFRKSLLNSSARGTRKIGKHHERREKNRKWTSVEWVREKGRSLDNWREIWNISNLYTKVSSNSFKKKLFRKKLNKIFFLKFPVEGSKIWKKIFSFFYFFIFCYFFFWKKILFLSLWKIKYQFKKFGDFRYHHHYHLITYSNS